MTVPRSLSAARIVPAAILALGSAVGLACGQTIVPIKEPDSCKLQVVEMSILASPRINLTEAGEARPVQTRVYQLATDTRLQNADYLELFKDDKKVLADDIVKVQEFPVYPDSRTDIRFERDDKALSLAVVSLFRSPKGRSWYTVFDLPPPPGKGNCYLKCKDGQCDGGPQLNPRYVVWIDGTRVDTGEDRLEDYPEPGKYQRVLAPMRTPGSSGSPAAAPRKPLKPGAAGEDEPDPAGRRGEGKGDSANNGDDGKGAEGKSGDSKP